MTRQTTLAYFLCFPFSSLYAGRGHDVLGRRGHGGDRHAHGLLPGERQDPEGGAGRIELCVFVLCVLLFRVLALLHGGVVLCTRVHFSPLLRYCFRFQSYRSLSCDHGLLSFRDGLV